MDVRHDLIARVQARMREEGLVAIVVVNHDDYRYLLATDQARSTVAGSWAMSLIRAPDTGSQESTSRHRSSP